MFQKNLKVKKIAAHESNLRPLIPHSGPIPTELAQLYMTREKYYIDYTLATSVPSILVIVAPHIRLRIIYFWIYVNYIMTPFALKLFILVLPT